MWTSGTLLNTGKMLTSKRHPVEKCPQRRWTKVSGGRKKPALCDATGAKVGPQVPETRDRQQPHLLELQAHHKPPQAESFLPGSRDPETSRVTLLWGVIDYTYKAIVWNLLLGTKFSSFVNQNWVTISTFTKSTSDMLSYTTPAGSLRR